MSDDANPRIPRRPQSQKPYAFGLIGFPLGHSLSPQIHHAALQTMGLPGEYQLFPIRPLPGGKPALDALLDRLQSGDVDGLNVTIPHKQSVLARLRHVSPTVRAVGAANTLYMRDGEIYGENTDIPGFLDDLASLAPFTAPAALVLGAGGAARAAVYALAREGWQVTVAARRVEQALELTKSLLTRFNLSDQGTIQAIQLDRDSLKRHLTNFGAGLVVNTTPVGMHPHPDASPWPDELPFPRSAALYEMIYNPRETLLLRQAVDQGARAKNGLGMLVEQAALALEIWTGQRVPRSAMWKAVIPPSELEVNHAA
jgi:shikimate dehydrogenase